MRPKVPDGACLCLPALGRVCVWCQQKAENPPGTVEALDGFDSPPWNPDDLPEHLRGKGYRGADQDGYDGSEWVSPVEHHAGDLVEAARVMLEAELM
jgi:hypothetical protein